MRTNSRYIGENIRSHMELRGLSQKEVAIKTEIKPPFLSDVINNKKPCPQGLLEKLAALFGIEESELEDCEDSSLADTRMYLESKKEIDRAMVHHIVHDYLRKTNISTAYEKKKILYEFIAFIGKGCNIKPLDERGNEITGQNREQDLFIIQIKKEKKTLTLSPNELLSLQHDMDRYKEMLFLELVNQRNEVVHKHE